MPRLFLLRILLPLWAAGALRAQTPADSSATPSNHVHAAMQFAAGVGFDDAEFGFNTRTRQLSLAGLTMSASGRHVSNGLLLLLLQGPFLDSAGRPSGESTRMEMEWTSRVAIRDESDGRSGAYIAGQLARDGAGFRADLVGLGVHAMVAGGDVWFTTYGRLIEGSATDAKARLEWGIPLHLAGAAIDFEGYEDVVGSRPRATEYSGLWQLLVRSGQLIGRPAERVEIGVKWFNHVYTMHATSAPLLMVRWGL